MTTDTASRVDAPEIRVSSLEETQYDLRRSSVKTELGVDRILDHLGLEQVTQAEVDEELGGR
ncbi:hypothetical protein ACIBEJ_44255 [Nonomuraea sp. NPDC050790]|uniref:hypothetical protein n=1 Tax=Nonomuraea sp. NPDC050790 TaxID=3364371 RepID=UPI0037A07455